MTTFIASLESVSTTTAQVTARAHPGRHRRIGYAALGVPQPVTWAVATALASLLPVIALLGGIEVLGLAGLIVAPIVMSVFVAAFRLYEREVRFASIPPPAGGPAEPLMDICVAVRQLVTCRLSDWHET